MVPEYNLNDPIKNKLSNDKISQLIALIITIVVLIYYVLTKEWQRANPSGFILIVVITLIQQFFINYKKTKNNKLFSSGGPVPLITYNFSIFILFTLYVPLYSPFMLLIPSVIFITVYFKGLYAFLLAIGNLTLIVTVFTVKYGFPPVSYGKYYPLLTIILGISFTGIVQRAGYIDNKIRNQLSKANLKIVDEREQLSSLINGIKDSVIATDQNGNIIFYNTQSLKLLGVVNIEEGSPFSKLIRLYDERSNLIDFFSLFVPELDQQSLYNLHLIDSNNQIVYLAIEVSKVMSSEENNQINGVIILIRDVTKEKSLDDERDEFVAVTSHELRTPIAIAEANLSLAMDKRLVGDLDPSIQDRLKQSHDGIMNLADLVNQLTELSDVERKNLEVENQMINPKDILVDLKRQYVDKALEKGLYINIEAEENIGQLFTSKVYLTEVIENFLTNAIKYTQKGGVTLKVKQSNENKNNILFSVIDTGDGIGNSDKDKIFTKFYRAEDYKRKHTRGTGLGLYLTLRIAKAINGKIWFSSMLHKGSIFNLEILGINQKTVLNKSKNREASK